MNASRWRLDGQLALVTGASRGIGLATVRELAGLGADVVLVARDEAHLDQVRDELAEEFPRSTLRVFAADVGEHEQRLQVFDFIADLGLELSLLVNNVGMNTPKPTLDYTVGEYRRIIETNVYSAFEM
ncbi:SDR family NAD(P)-dependent oxidoreductase, partial [Dokdonella sp.]